MDYVTSNNVMSNNLGALVDINRKYNVAME